MSQLQTIELPPGERRVRLDHGQRYKQLKLPLSGRFMRPDKQEFPCRVLTISVGGADIATEESIQHGDRIVAYLEHLGGVEGHVTHVFAGGFTMEFHITVHRQQKIADQLTWLLNHAEIGEAAKRRPGHERIALDRKPITVTLPDGETTQCAALDVSISGAKIESDLRPPIGSELMVAKLRARIVRHHHAGFSVEFTDIQEVKAIRRHFG